MADAAAQLVAGLVEAGNVPPPGFGHRYHAIDPRATRLLQVAHELEDDHAYTQMLRAVEQALARHEDLQGRPLGANIDGAIAAVCGNLGLAPDVADALLIISRVPGLSAHVLEERLRESPFRTIDPTRHRYDGPPERRLPEGRK
jgi:citrate synthase